MIIVDDEALARRGLRQHMERHRGIRVLTECATRAEAARAIATHDPDIVFLDIHMSGGSGFDVLDEIGTGVRPVVIFVTAYSEHAVRAFEVNAVDYVLKPVDDARFDQALDRARARLRAGSSANAADRIQAVARALASAAQTSGSKAARRVAIDDGQKTLLVSVDEIDWLEAAGNYVYVHAGRRKILTRGTLGGLTAMIGDPRFMRVHRSAIVNRDAIVQIETAGKSLYVLGLRGGGRVETSYHYRSAVVDLLPMR
ncbi:MAG: LytR/AlgR family response regulator transcription factor [Gemmatimonadales bacterium]